MIQNKFSWSRTGALTKGYVTENGSSLKLAAGVIFGFMLAMAMLMTKTFSDPEIDMSITRRASTLLPTLCVMSLIGSVILGSMVCSSYSTKTKRISSLMLPAAQSEKFVSRLLIYVVGGNFFLLLCAWISDTVSALVFGMTPAWLAVNVFTEIFGKVDFEDGLAMFLVFLWFTLIGQSLYVMGSTLWPRLSFLKTFVALMFIQIILPIIMPFMFISDFMDWLMEVVRGLDISDTTARIIGWCGIGLLYVLLAGIYCGAWKIFRRMQVIQRFKMK